MIYSEDIVDDSTQDEINRIIEENKKVILEQELLSYAKEFDVNQEMSEKSENTIQFSDKLISYDDLSNDSDMIMFLQNHNDYKELLEKYCPLFSPLWNISIKTEVSSAKKWIYDQLQFQQHSQNVSQLETKLVHLSGEITRLTKVCDAVKITAGTVSEISSIKAIVDQFSYKMDRMLISPAVIDSGSLVPSGSSVISHERERVNQTTSKELTLEEKKQYIRSLM